jgi:hypothetical protein
LVWAAPGRDKATLVSFFRLLGRKRCLKITHVSADGADWISDVVSRYCLNAVQGADPFHVVSWATEALDEVRREAWNAARGGKSGRTEQSKALKNPRWELWKNEADLTEAQQAKLDWTRHRRWWKPGPGRRHRRTGRWRRGCSSAALRNRDGSPITPDDASVEGVAAEPAPEPLSCPAGGAHPIAKVTAVSAPTIP